MIRQMTVAEVAELSRVLAERARDIRRERARTNARAARARRK